MSARAAWRLESLGLERVYRYTAGKEDWFAAGLPREGRLSAVPRAGDVARRGVPTCAPDERVGDVRARVRDAGGDRAVVVNAQRIVLGVLDHLALQAEPDAPAEAVMDAGPVTYRPDTLQSELVHHLQEHGVSAALITTADGELVGLFCRDDEHQHEAATKASGSADQS